MEFRKLKDLKLDGKKVFLRLDLNVPMKDGKITDDTRIRAAIPTLKHILEHTNKVAVATHLGRPKGAPDPKYSVEPVAARLAELLDREVVFVADYDKEPVEQVLPQLNDDQFVVLENLRFHPGETENDNEFARELMRGFDLYVNDAFGTLHRAHASVVGAAECVKPQNRAAGFLVEKEIEVLSGLQKHPKSPYTVIIGGSKVSDKIGIILSLLNKCNNLLVGGAMAYTFLKYKGAAVGASRVEEDKLDLVETIYRNAEQRRVRIVLPKDHVCASEFAETAKPVVVAAPDIPAGLMGLDIGPATAMEYAAIIKESKTIFWNGPMGVFEWPAFAKGSMEVAKAMAEVGGTTVIGGGDSVAAANMAGIADKIYHISTGGGASMEFLEGKTLPGVKVLMK